MKDFIQPVVLTFDPSKSLLTRSLFDDYTSRTLWMLWKLEHIVDDNFINYVVDVASEINLNRPETAQEMEKCFPTRQGTHQYWSVNDVKRFCEVAIPYFNGERICSYKIKGMEPQCTNTQS